MNNVCKINVRLEDGARLPVYSSAQAAGADLCAFLPAGDIIIEAGKHVLVPTGISLALPAGFEAQIRPRSGLAAKYGISVLNAPGTVDSDYRGEICVILVNFSDRPFTIHDGDRIAQIVISRHETAVFTETDVLDITERGTGGFGSTGVGS